MSPAYSPDPPERGKCLSPQTCESVLLDNFICFLFFFLGLIVGAILRYSGDRTSVSHILVVPAEGANYSESVPPDTLWLRNYNGK